MKKWTKSIAVALSILAIASCKKDPTPTPQPPGETEAVVLAGNLTTQTLTSDKKYLLRGQVFVREGQTLTIQPGTVIMGQKSSKGTLVIDRGGKIMAKGTKEKPIIMTSDQAPGNRSRGDWGGLVVLGKAPVNIPNPSIEGITPEVQYGGTDPNDNSGEMEFLRVEFAGIELSINNETNSITLGGVGRGTKFENIMVSYGGDDGIEWFGGTVDGKHLVSLATWDDCFDIDNGFSGNLQFGLSLRYPSFADQSESNGFEWDTDGQNDLTRTKTTVVASNFTVIGPFIDGNSASSNYRYGVDLRRNVAGSIFNSVFVGFPNAIRMNQSSVLPNYLDGTGVIENNIFYAKTAGVVSGSSQATEIQNYLTSKNNTVQAGADYEKSAAYTALGINPNLFYNKRLHDAAFTTAPNFAVTSGTIATGASFANAKFSETNRTGKFQTVAYRGAFGATDWTAGWTEFNPATKAY